MKTTVFLITAFNCEGSRFQEEILATTEEEAISKLHAKADETIHVLWVEEIAEQHPKVKIIA